jgi:hypothetical protein
VINHDSATPRCTGEQRVYLQADGTEACEEPHSFTDHAAQPLLPVPTVQPGQALAYQPLTTETDEWQCLALTTPQSSPWTCDLAYRKQFTALYETTQPFILSSAYGDMMLLHDAQGRPLTVTQDDVRLLFQPVER